MNGRWGLNIGWNCLGGGIQYLVLTMIEAPDVEVVGASLPITHPHPTVHHYHFVDAGIIIFHIKRARYRIAMPCSCGLSNRAHTSYPCPLTLRIPQWRDPPPHPRSSHCRKYTYNS